MDINVKTFNQDSEKYFLYRPKYPKELYEFIKVVSHEHNTVWDCACGNGQVSIDISEYFSLVEGSDINENQILNAFKKENIKYSVQNSEYTNYSDNYFDVVCVGQALHWFSSDDFFKEVKRVLKKDGTFFCWGYSFFKISDEIDEIIKNKFLNLIDPYWSEKNRILHNEYLDINFPFEKIDTPKIQMSEMWNLSQLTDYLNTWSAVKLYNEKNGGDIVEFLKSKLENHWDTSEDKKIKMNFIVYGGKNK